MLNQNKNYDSIRTMKIVWFITVLKYIKIQEKKRVYFNYNQRKGDIHFINFYNLELH